MPLVLIALALTLGSAGTFDPAELVPVAVPEPSPLAIHYYRTGIAVWAVAKGWHLVVPAALLLSGLSARLRDLARRVGRTWLGMVALYGFLYVGLTALIDLPIDFTLGYLRGRSYGLVTQSPIAWLVDTLIAVAVSLGLTALLLPIPYAILGRSPRRWWLWVGLLTPPAALAATYVKPIAFDPLFNRFAPMRDKALEAKILALAAEAGVEAGRVFEVDKGRETSAMNAYVTGLLGTKRIVLWDTLIARLDERETLAVVGHEIGHYVLNHVAWGVAMATSGSLVVLFLVDRLGRAMVARWGRRFGFDRLSDVASVPLIVLLLQAINLVAAPIPLAISRAIEHEADRFALEITRTNRSAATAFAKMVTENLSNPRPDPLSIFWRSTHPSIGERIDFCNAYHPWSEGRPGRYDGRFAPSEPR